MGCSEYKQMRELYNKLSLVDYVRLICCSFYGLFNTFLYAAL
ncbi:hypothetical protein BAT02nite_41020 [Bacillus atrophaeus]|nr:hypothetical protein BAT02nite_41020 [Bacillus atrophaeus]